MSGSLRSAGSHERVRAGLASKRQTAPRAVTARPKARRGRQRAAVSRVIVPAVFVAAAPIAESRTTARTLSAAAAWNTSRKGVFVSLRF